MHNILGDGEALFRSGSFAELYIRPILHCYGDIDIMHSHMTELAIPLGTLPHTETWYCHQDTVTVYEIIDSHKPGYVYLQQSYIALYYGISNELMRRLQSVQNAAARLITGTQRCDHITPVLRQLHWLPVRQRVD